MLSFLVAALLGAPQTLIIQSQPPVELQDGVLSDRRLLDALRPRLQPFEIQARLGDREPGAFYAHIHRQESGELVLEMFDTDSVSLKVASIPTEGRRADDLVDTLALLISEVLTPLLPPLGEERPPALAPEEPDPGAPVPAPVADPSPPAPRFRLSLFGGVQHHAPRSHLVYGGRVQGELLLGLWLLEIAVDAWSPIAGAGEALSVSAAHAAISPAAGWHGRWDSVSITVATGPTLRFGRATARGEGLAREAAGFVDWGWSANVAGCWHWGPWSACALATGVRYVDLTRLVADGQVLVNLGPGTSAFLVGAGRAF